MNDILIELIRTIPSLATLAGIIYGIRVAQKGVNVSKGNAVTLDRVEQHTNGILAATKSDAMAAGIKQGADDERARAADNPK